MGEYKLVGGGALTEDDIERIGRECERGTYHEVTGSRVVRPPIRWDGSVTIGVRMPPGLRAAIEGRAREQGMSMSAYMRSVLVSDLLGCRLDGDRTA
jgi:predicted HicB family RNase H-like nuclease